MDFLADLIEAIARVERRARMGGGGRRLGKKKKPKMASGRPAKTGPSAGCGTGAGGFKAGNNCAKEDGIPRKPLSQGGALKGVNAKETLDRAKAMKEKAAAKKSAKEAADKAKSAEMKPQRDKRKKIAALRKEAARRKAEKGERDAAEKKAAQEAADKKRAEMLQKIRIKKANQQLNVIEKPAGKYLGEVDRSITKNEGETQFEFAKRRLDADLQRLHKEIDDIEARADLASKQIGSKIQELAEREVIARNELQEHAAKIGKDGRRPTIKELEELDRLKKVSNDLRAEKNAAHDRADKLEQLRTDETHDAISEFVKAHGKGLASADYKQQFADKDALDRSRSASKEQFVENSKKAWGFLSKVLSPLHQEKLTAIRVKLDTTSGDADYNDATQLARHGSRGNNVHHHISDPTIVHEIAHGLHYGAHAKQAAGKSLQESAQDWMESPGYKARLAIKEDYDARVAKLQADNPQGLEQVAFHPQRQQYSLWKPKNEPRRRESYLGYVDQYCDAEHNSAINATEVISMGVQSVYNKPRSFRKNHRSHFDLTLLFMAGRLH